MKLDLYKLSNRDKDFIELTKNLARNNDDLGKINIIFNKYESFLKLQNDSENLVRENMVSRGEIEEEPSKFAKRMMAELEPDDLNLSILEGLGSGL